MNTFEEKVLEVTKVLEDHVDETLEKLENMKIDDWDSMLRKREAELRKELKQKREWIEKGHGEYSTLTSEKEFFEVSKKSENIVLHCYRTSSFRCDIVDKHLDVLARKHCEAKFCRMDVEKAPFLCNRLKIRVIPTIILVKDAITVDYIIGFDDLGGVDDFPIEMLEWRIARGGVLKYDGDLSFPPEPVAAKGNVKRYNIKHVKKNIRGGNEDSDSTDSDQ